MVKGNRVPFILVAVFLGILMVNIDGMIVSTAMPTVIADLGGMNLFSWVTAAYMLSSTVFIPLFGKLADLYGKKLFLLLGFIIFTVSSALCASSETMSQLIWYRALQGIGGAPLMPLAFAMIFEIIPLEKRGRMQAMLMATNGVSLIAGPEVGSWLTEKLSWHWVFLINVPFGVLATVLLIFFYTEATSRKRAVVDYAGFTTLTVCITTFMFALVMGGVDYAWSSWQIVSLLTVSALFLVLFLLAERKAVEPMIPLGIFRAPVISATGISFLLGLIMVAAMGYIPLFVQGVAWGSASSAGHALTPVSIALIVGTMAGNLLMSRLSFRVSMLASAAPLALSCVMLTNLTPQTGHGYVVAAMIIMGIGMGPLFPLTTMLMQISVQRGNSSMATSLISFFRNIGVAIGSSIFAVLLNNRMHHAAELLPSANSAADGGAAVTISSQALMDEKARALIPGPTLHILRDGLNDGIVWVFTATVAVAAGMLMLSFLAGRARMTQLQQSTDVRAGEAGMME